MLSLWLQKHRYSPIHSRELPAWGLASGLSLTFCCSERLSPSSHEISQNLLPCEEKPIKTIAVTTSGGAKSNAILWAKMICKLQAHELFFPFSVFVVKMVPEGLLCSWGLSAIFLEPSQAPGVTMASCLVSSSMLAPAPSPCSVFSLRLPRLHPQLGYFLVGVLAHAACRILLL